MEARLRARWQRIKEPLEISIIGIFLVGLLALVILIILGYIFHWDWIGLSPYVSPTHSKDTDFQRGKTLWDWLQLLIIPAVLAAGGYGLSLVFLRKDTPSV
ncbi:MAG: hypothetical protein NVS4B9_37120 [Ktedonobacteraceae bacterium]